MEDFKSHSDPQEEVKTPSDDTDSLSMGSSEGSAHKTNQSKEQESDGDYDLFEDKHNQSSLATSLYQNSNSDLSSEEFDRMMKAQNSTLKTKKTETKLGSIDWKTLEVLVSDSLVKKGGMFSFSFPTYKITLRPLGWSVRRKEAEFIYLRKYLLKTYPNQFVRILIFTFKLDPSSDYNRGKLVERENEGKRRTL